MHQFRDGDVVRLLSWDELVARGATLFEERPHFLDLGPDTNFLYAKDFSEVAGKTFKVELERHPDSSGSDLEQVLGSSRALDAPGSNFPITNFMVELAVTKYPTNRKLHAHKV